MPVLQNMGTYVRAGLQDSGVLFEHMARKYLIEPDEGGRTAVCKENAKVGTLLMPVYE